MIFRRLGFAAIAACLWFSAGSAVATVTLPLDGYCKPGRFFPIAVEGTDTGQSMSFSADGCLPSRMEPSTAGHVMVLMLATSVARELHWPGGKLQLRMPGDDERLIATVTGRIDLAETVFPGKRLLPVRLDSANPLPGPSVAWETLDAILLDSALFVRVTDAQRSTLLSGGVALISVGDSPPDTRWPWRKMDSVWVLSDPISGPNGDVINENIYAPTFGWAPDLPASVRGQVMGVGTLGVMGVLALMLRQNRFTFFAALALCLIATGGIIFWRHTLPTVDRAGGDAVVASGPLLQRDAFVYERAKESSTQAVRWTGWTHPLFASAAAMNRADMRLTVSGNDELSFIYQAAPGHTMAFLRREIQPGTLPAVTPSHDSPMQEAAKTNYLTHGDRIVGEIPGSNNRWPAVIIQKKQ